MAYLGHVILAQGVAMDADKVSLSKHGLLPRCYA
jgi:hypothetical protein